MKLIQKLKWNSQHANISAVLQIIRNIYGAVPSCKCEKLKRLFGLSDFSFILDVEFMLI